MYRRTSIQGTCKNEVEKFNEILAENNLEEAGFCLPYLYVLIFVSEASGESRWSI